ncbi:Site-specific recombinase XerD [Tangfeifania diversioriginum]|uniref:Site-specific recombinase XerD n=1 Tax=Tangfeifania diversioriginum TaxID=1168035 RepID=A0A1M6JLU5_9BACT|nr:site-specific integrase [Tangfeifania diversioriginum]SHJ47666.1 Site-specific recombinase XerD [Tangfeifania diversioriginum]
MKYTLNVLFVLRKAQSDKRGFAPIYLRISVNGERAELSVNRKIAPKKWDAKLQRAIGRSEAARALNDYLDSLENQVKKNFNKLLDNEEEISSAILRDMQTGKYIKNHTLLSVFEMNNQLVEQEEGSKYSRSTIDQYKTTLSRLKLFLEQQYACKDMALTKLDLTFIRRFEIFLKTEYGIHHNTIMKHLKQVKKVIHFAMEMGYIDRDPFFSHKTAYKNVSRDYLTADELHSIETHTFRIKRLEQVKDVFLFVCYTGLSYSDLKTLTRDNLSKGIDGKTWIVYERKKTDVQARIPLLPMAQALIDKYENDPECSAENKILPVRSNQKLNSYLSEIAEICGISKHITMHLGRHTFATTVTLTNGVPIESVSKMLGHTSLKTTQIYSKVIDNKVSKEMEDLSKVLESNKKKGENGNEKSGNNKIAL